MHFQQPALPSGKAPLSNLTKLRDVASIGCNDPELALRQVQVYDWFELWNERFFSNRLRPVHINVSLTPYGKYLGLCHYAPTQFIEIHPQCWKGRANHHQHAVGDLQMPSAAWVVLHEMIHLAEAQTLGYSDDNGHTTETWVGWCNYIAEQLDIPLSYAPMKRGKDKADADGKRANVWKASKDAEVRPGTRMATYDETRCFPFLIKDVVVKENTTVDKNGVEVLPRF